MNKKHCELLKTAQKDLISAWDKLFTFEVEYWQCETMTQDILNTIHTLEKLIKDAEDDRGATKNPQ